MTQDYYTISLRIGLPVARPRAAAPRTAVDDDEGWLAARCADVLKHSTGGAVACVLHNERYALAKVWDRRRMDSLSIASLENELKALRDAQIQRGFLALASSPDTVALVTEYYPRGDLDRRRRRRGGSGLFLAFLLLRREAAQGFLQRFGSRALQRAGADGNFDAVGGIRFNND